jgi:hypothetical protein
MADYKQPLATLEAAGIRLAPTASMARQEAIALPAEAKRLTDQSNTIAQLKQEIAVKPNSPAAIRSLADAEAAIADVSAALQDKQKFLKLVSFGSGVDEKLMNLGVSGPIKIPVGITTEILYNNVNRFLRERLSAKVADKIGRELLDSGALEKALQNLRGQSPVPQNTLAQRAVGFAKKATPNALLTLPIED